MTRPPDITSQDRLDANLTAIASHSPEVAERLRSTVPRIDLELGVATSGVPTARVGNSSLHSAYDPVREARRLVADQVKPDATSCVTLGFGLGYHAEEVQRAYPDMPLAVVEPDLPLIVAALRARDLTGLLASPTVRLLLAATPEEVTTAVEHLPLSGMAIVCTAPLRGLDPDYYGRVEASLRAAADRKQINVNTLARFGRLWVRNLLRNVTPIVSSPGVSSLSGRFSGIPALVLAAGPSLDTLEPLLPRLRERMLVLAVDSSLATCLRQSVDPDFVVTVDPQYWNTRYFDRLRPVSSLLVCEPSTNPSSLRRLRLPSFFTSSLFPLGRLLESVAGEKGRVGAGGSVATSAWDVARIMGCSPIYMAGLDLGFPDRRTHARGLYFEELMVTTATRVSPVETQSHRYLTEAGSLRVPSTDGGQTRTDRRMLVYKWWFERQLASSSAPPTRTLSLRGVRIDGMPYASADSLMPLPSVRQAVRTRLDAAREERPSPQEAGRVRGAVLDALAELLDDLEAVSREAREGLAETARLGSLVQRRPQERGASGAGKGVLDRLRVLDEVDRRILSHASREMAGFLMQPLINDIVSSRGDAKDAVEASRRLYQELAQTSELHAALVREALRVLRSD